MSDLSGLDRNKLEKAFMMADGFVLLLSNRMFKEFFEDYSVDIYSDRYAAKGNSKANRMRLFWKLDSNLAVGSIINGLLDLVKEDDQLGRIDQQLETQCRQIALSLLTTFKSVPEIDSIAAVDNSNEFELLVQSIRDSISQGQPVQALDRLHTYTVKFMRYVLVKAGIEIVKEKPLHSLLGEYIKTLKESNLVRSKMSEMILKSTISVFEGFNSVRNDMSLAHDNPVLGSEESLYILNDVANFIRFIRSLAEKLDASVSEPSKVEFERSNAEL